MTHTICVNVWTLSAIEWNENNIQCSILSIAIKRMSSETNISNKKKRRIKSNEAISNEFYGTSFGYCL